LAWLRSFFLINLTCDFSHDFGPLDLQQGVLNLHAKLKGIDWIRKSLEKGQRKMERNKDN
jgi:hypothetical protein